MELLCLKKCLFCNEDQLYTLEKEIHGLCDSHRRDFIDNHNCIHCGSLFSVCQYLKKNFNDNFSTRFCSICTNSSSQDCVHLLPKQAQSISECDYCLELLITKKFDCGHSLCQRCSKLGCSKCIKDESSSNISFSNFSFVKHAEEISKKTSESTSLMPNYRTLNPVRLNEGNHPEILASELSFPPAVVNYEQKESKKSNLGNNNNPREESKEENHNARLAEQNKPVAVPQVENPGILDSNGKKKRKKICCFICCIIQ